MKLFNIKFLLVGITSLILFSCEKDTGADPLFSENPTERINEQEKELRDLLKSSEHGWKVTYFTDHPEFTNKYEHQLGAWNFLFNFTDDRNVDMISDFSETPTTPEQSEYDIVVGSTTKLSFSTGSIITYFTGGANSPLFSGLRGQGHKADFEFLYYGKDGDDLIFKTNRFQITLKFEKATAEDWTTNMQQKINIKETLEAQVKLKMETVIDGNTTVYNDVYYDIYSRYITNMETKGNVAYENDFSFGIGFTEEGLITAKPIVLGNEEIFNLTYNQGGNFFLGTSANGNTIKLYLEQRQVIDVLQKEYFRGLNFSSYAFPESSPKFRESIFYNAAQYFSGEQWSLLGFFIVPNNTIEYLLYDQNGDLIRYNYSITGLTYDNSTSTIIFGSGTWGTQTPVPADHKNALQTINDFILHNQGLKLIQTGVVKDGSLVYILESNNDPELWMAVDGVPYSS
ncbi:MAG: DUF4302 domain-containing protein [Mesonia hippocampi]|uniref:DUF4302 domain-containing protein n=1 Tax=Mesonia hippocampi TaxID=1628250 RepID=UPI003F9B78A3